MPSARSIAAASPGIVRRPIKRSIRRFGIATSGLRPLPDYLIIGAHRAGTTSLYRYLEQHPCVARNFPRAQDVKGVRYFDQHFTMGTRWYRSHFPTAAHRRYLRRLHGAPVVAGDASSYYLLHPAAAERAAGVEPEAKIIVLLRDPIERAYSHWKRERRDGMEELTSFEAALAAEPARLSREVDRILADDAYYSYAHENFSYLTQGLYLEPLRRWLAHYPRERVHIVLSERMLKDPQGTFDDVLEFLGLPALALRNATAFNTTPSGSELSSATRAALLARLAPEIDRLEEYLGFELGWMEAPGANQDLAIASASG